MTKRRSSRENPAVREFVLSNVRAHPRDISSLAMRQFGLSRQSIVGYLSRLIDEGILLANGHTSARSYTFRTVVDETFQIQLSVGLGEDAIWRFRILPKLAAVKQNVLDICQYGFTEMLNNAIDHSASPDCLISYSYEYDRIDLWVIDRGIGIFEKIQRDFNLPDPRSALLELSKGKLTSSPKHHAGEGIFYTSRMFDDFCIESGHLFYRKSRMDHDEWMLEARDKEEYHKGTLVRMRISPHATWTPRDIFERYQGDEHKFRKTHVPVSLARYAHEQLVSRSQAKRVLARFNDFSEILLDFEDVEEIGQPFADEIFRVFARAHPDIPIYAVRANQNVKEMIESVKALPATEGDEVTSSHTS